MNDDTIDAFIFGAIAFVVIALIGLLMATGIVDGEGRKDWNHTGPVPERAEQMSAHAYLADDRQTALAICNKTTIDHEYTPLMGKFYVFCEDEQTWNDDRSKSKNFANAFSDVITSSTTLIFTGVLVLLCGAFGLVLLTNDLIGMLTTRRRRKRGQMGLKRKGLILRQDLAELLTQKRITSDEYETRIFELHEEYPELLELERKDQHV